MRYKTIMIAKNIFYKRGSVLKDVTVLLKPNLLCSQMQKCIKILFRKMMTYTENI